MGGCLRTWACKSFYLGLGTYGWLNWLFGGEKRTVLKISKTTRVEWLVMAALIPLGTWGFREILLVVNGAAPFWDSLTTVLSLAAQYLLCRKRFENWFSLDRRRCHLRPALPEPAFATHSRAIRRVSGHVPHRRARVEPQHEERKRYAMKFGLGLVIGNFYPPHRGHKLLD